MLCSSLEYYVFFTFPLTLLALLAPLLWVLPAASLLVSLSVCALAAAQADLPPGKKRLWSRPLIALLYALQPLERGIARYRTARQRGTPGSTAAAVRVPPLSVPATGEVVYWSDGRVDRFQLLAGLKERLTKVRWAFREDSGWESFDIEIQSHPWTRVQLVTVHEDLEMGRRNIRCRFRSRWTLPVVVVFWSLVAVELVLIRSLAGTWPWAWMLLLVLPLIMLLIEHWEYRTAGQVNGLLKELAEELGLVSLIPKTQQEPQTPP
jgi:hypothetical protein